MTRLDPSVLSSLRPSEVAYIGLVKLHALDLAKSAAYRASRSLPAKQIAAIARDLADLSNPHPLDKTIDAVLERADALERERSAVL